jgi:hypothetical protein
MPSRPGFSGGFAQNAGGFTRRGGKRLRMTHGCDAAFGGESVSIRG